jgi:PilZ domain
MTRCGTRSSRGGPPRAGSTTLVGFRPPPPRWHDWSVDLPGWLPIALIGACVVAAAAALFGRRGRRSRFVRLGRACGLTREDLRFLVGAARRASLDPLRVLRHLSAFERATATALDDDAAAGRIRWIRRRLGFDRAPPGTPLLTTRELESGAAIEAGSCRGEVCAVDERSFSVEVWGPAPAAGADLPLVLLRPGDARYRLRCRLLARGPGPGEGRSLLVYAHDEQPRRIQRREFVRVKARGAVALRVLGTNGAGQDLLGELVDVSAGGALVLTAPVTPGASVGVSLVIGERRFAGVSATVVSSRPRTDGRCRTQLRFRAMREVERQRLIAAVAAAQRASRGLALRQPAT